MIKRKHSLLSKKIDIVFLILSPIFATIASLIFRTDYFTSTLLFFGIPAIYLSFRNNHAVKKSFIFALIMGVVGAFIGDFFAVSSLAWVVPHTVFSLRLFNLVPVEDLVWGFLLVYDIIMLYEHFLDKGRHNLKDTNLKYFIVAAISLLVVTFLIYYLNRSFLDIRYFYISAGLIFVLLPIVSFLSFFPRLVSKFVKAGAYFFYQGLMFELVGLSLNHWRFNGKDYIGWVTISLFKLQFPIEEFVFWMVLFSTCVLSYYEFFDDDQK
ncbi:hypothetical protein M1328_02400 [Patescibacteria group bacterium]|nr:hypothetical protein [Patescibacteria group bacterium]